MSVIAWFQTEEDWVQVLILWVYRGFISTRATNSESDNDPYKIFKYGVYYVACVQPPLPSKKLERIFLRGGAAVHRLGVYQTNTSHLKMWQFT